MEYTESRVEKRKAERVAIDSDNEDLREAGSSQKRALGDGSAAYLVACRRAELRQQRELRRAAHEEQVRRASSVLLECLKLQPRPDGWCEDVFPAGGTLREMFGLWLDRAKGDENGVDVVGVKIGGGDEKGVAEKGDATGRGSIVGIGKEVGMESDALLLAACACSCVNTMRCSTLLIAWSAQFRPICGSTHFTSAASGGSMAYLAWLYTTLRVTTLINPN